MEPDSAQKERQLTEPLSGRLRTGWAQAAAITVNLSKRTLTNLYNALTRYRQEVKGKQRLPQAWKEAVKSIISLDEIETLDHIHNTLHNAVLDAYGWPRNLSDEQILERLLALNLQRAAAARTP